MMRTILPDIQVLPKNPKTPNLENLQIVKTLNPKTLQKPEGASFELSNMYTDLI
jgi:hypothetical protein